MQEQRCQMVLARSMSPWTSARSTGVSFAVSHIILFRRENAVNWVYPVVLRNIEKQPLLTNLHERTQTFAGGRAERAASSSRTT